MVAPGDVVAVTVALEALVPLSVTEAGDTVQVPDGGALQAMIDSHTHDRLGR